MDGYRALNSVCMNNTVVIRVSKKRYQTGTGLFGLGLHLTENNIITSIDKGGDIYEDYKECIHPGMKLTHIQNKELSSKPNENATAILQQLQKNEIQHYVLKFSKNNII